MRLNREDRTRGCEIGRYIFRVGVGVGWGGLGMGASKWFSNFVRSLTPDASGARQLKARTRLFYSERWL